MNIIRVGVDIAKSVFHIHGVDRHGQIQWQGKYTRSKWLDAICRKVPKGTEIGRRRVHHLTTGPGSSKTEAITSGLSQPNL